MKPRGDVTKSPKQGYQWPHKKDLCPPKFKKKKKLLPILFAESIFLLLEVTRDLQMRVFLFPTATVYQMEVHWFPLPRSPDTMSTPLADLSGAPVRDACPPGPNHFNYMQFSEKIGKILC